MARKLENGMAIYFQNRMHD